MTPHGHGTTSAARVAGVYLLAGVLWILLSDLALAAIVSDPEALSSLQTVKGWLFVTASAGLIAWLVGRELRRATSNEARFQALADQGVVGTFAVRRGRLVHANRRLEEIFGHARGDLVGKRIMGLVARDARAQLRQVPEAQDDGSPSVVRLRLDGIRRDGASVPIEVHGRMIDWDGLPALAGIVVDRSDQIRLQDRLRQAGRLEALGEVTGSVAHDFNNFLAGILTNLDLALIELAEDPANAQESLRVVRDAASRAASLTGQLLHFSRGRAFQHRSMDVNAHIQRLVDFLRSLADGGRTVRLELQDDIPPILLDPMALDQLLLNLFVNAKQATEPGGTIVIRTRSRTSSAGSDVFVEVQDDGVGMPRDVLDRMFEPFFTTKERGTGLGLATVRGIMDEARGHFVVESAPGEGTTVRLLFPAAVSAFRREAEGGRHRVGREASQGARVLVVETDPGVSRVVAVALRRAGYQTVEAHRSEEALALASSGGGTLDLVILDGTLPEVRDGSLLRALRRIHEPVRFLVTAMEHPEEEGRSFGAVGLTKPFSLDVLLGAAAAALGERGDATREKSRGA